MQTTIPSSVHLGDWCPPRPSYMIPKALFQFGHNLISKGCCSGSALIVFLALSILPSATSIHTSSRTSGI